MAVVNAIGLIPVSQAQGGTGSTSFSSGSVVFSNGTILTQDNANLFWDDTNNRLGIGIATPLDNFHVVGAMELDHVAAENDYHAIEIVCDANGFTDVKALDIDYITGALAAGEDEEAILVNIDETASTGGIMAGYLVLSTAEGSATVNGYETGVNVNPIVQESGTFGDADNILNIAVDVTAALASGGAGNISIFVADNDTITIGDAAQFGELEIILGTPASGSGVAPTFEYSTGAAAFSAFSPADGTNGFRNTGAILWDASTLAGWVVATSGRYEIRITRTRNTLATTPIIDELQIAALTEYKWDKNGDLNVNSLTLTTPLDETDGGTGQSTYATGDILYASAANTLSKLAAGSNDNVLTLAAGVPSWAAPSGGGWYPIPTYDDTGATAYFGLPAQTGASSNNVGNQRLYLTRCIVGQTLTCTKMETHINTGVAGAVGRMGIYSSDANGFADALLVDGGTFSAATSSSDPTVNISQSLTAGVLYWLGIVIDENGGSVQTRAFNFSSVEYSTSASAPIQYYYQDTVDPAIALPATLTTAGNSTLPAPQIALYF